MVKNIYSLTPLQEGMLFHSLYREDTTPYFEQMDFNINGDFDIELFRKSWNKLIDRYDIFRTIFVYKNTPSPKQVVLKSGKIDLTYEDISTFKNKKEYINDFIEKSKKRYFDLSKKTPLKVQIFKLKDNSYRVVFAFHHILMDGWSGGIIFSELFTIYNSLKEGTILKLPPVKPYSQYIKWLKEQDKTKSRDFWKEYLSGYNSGSSLPRLSDTDGYKFAKDMFIIDSDRTSKLNKFVQKNSLTLNTIIQTIWGIVVGKIIKRRDIVFGATVSGRVDEIDGIEKMVGLFINAIPIRIKFSDSDTLLDIAKSVMISSLEAKNHHYFSLADIQNLTPLKDNLVEQLLVFENYPTPDSDSSKMDFDIDDLEVFNQTNYNFDITIVPSNTISVMFKYNSLLYSKTLIDELQNSFLELVDLYIEEPNKVIKSIVNSSTKTAFVSSSFTADLIEDGFIFWSKKFGMDLELSFSGYNQIMQDILDKNSPLYRDDGINILMIRFEDVLRFLKLKDKNQKIEQIEKNFKKIVLAIESSSFLIPTFITIFKPIESKLSETLNLLYEKLILTLKDKNNIYLVDFRELDSLYQVGKVFDLHSDKTGHIPFTDEYFWAMGSFLSRQVYALYNPHFKVIALDCDNTLWRGIVGEDGALGVGIDGGYLELQKFVLEREKEGFLVVLNSKNNENDAWEVFDTNSDMLLKREHIVHSKINWNPKSQNLKEMAKELNLGLNSFVFLDDNPLECSEVIANAPEVLSLPLPKNPDSFKSFLGHIWALDKIKVTKEDRNRTKMYQAETQRNQNSQKLSLDDFLESLELKIYMNQMLPSQLARTSQLIQRTNQFNVSTIRRSESDIKAIIEDDSSICWTVNVEDKFGSYGLVGVIITKNEDDRLIIDTFLMSCRVLGRGVEKSILAGLKRYADEHNLKSVEMPFYPTKKNQPALNFIEESSFVLKTSDSKRSIYEMSVDILPIVDLFVEFHFDKGITTLKKELKEDENISVELEVVEERKLFDDFSFDFLETLDKKDIDKIVHKKFYEPLKYHKAIDKLELMSQDIESNEFTAPITEKEKILSTTYQELLNIKKIGIKDNFFKLGGHSLLATRLLSRVYQSFKVSLTLKEIFENPTIKELVKLLEKDSIVKVEIIKAPEMKNYPLSIMQKRVWLIDKIGGGVAYSMPIALEVEGKLDIKRLSFAFNSMIKRHEILRTYIKTIDDEPRQKIVNNSNIDIVVKKAKRDEILSDIEEDIYKAFKLSSSPLFRLKVYKLKKNIHIIYLNMNHIISDGWSIGVITKEITTLYNSQELPVLNLQYKDFSFWQNSILESKKNSKDRDYWFNKLKDKIEPLDFPTDYPRLKEHSFVGDTITLDLSKRLEKINNLNQNSQTTLFMFLVSAVKIILARYTMQKDIILGYPISGRESVELENQIGFYANTLILRDSVDFENDFMTLLYQVRNSILEAHEHQNYPFEMLLEELNIPRNLSRSPIFDYAISLNGDGGEVLNLGNATIKPFEFDFNMAQFDMSFNFNFSPDSLYLNLNYNSDLFKKSTIKRFIKHIDNLIKAILKSPDKNIKNIDFLSKKEKNKEFRTSTVKKSSFIKLFKEQVEKTPYTTAVIYKDTKLTYQELNQISNRTAESLIKEYNIKPNDRVAFMLDRALTPIVILAILKVGATFIPINSSLPKDKVDYILDDANAKLLIDNEFFIKSINYSEDNIFKGNNNLDSSAYIIYTSGTTGKPKGVEVSQKSLLNLLYWYIDDFNIDTNTKALLMIPPSFDASIKNILAPLIMGGEVVISHKKFDPFDLVETIKDNGVTLINCVPSAFSAILDVADKEYSQLKSLEYLALGGERLELNLFKDFYFSSNIQLFNIYGPTEATDISTIYKVKKEDFKKRTIPIGKSITNSRVYIVDKFDNIVPKGIIGEIVIEGIGVAKGYINNSIKFNKIYKTGDLAKELKSGDIEFFGRVDDQVKIRGNRVELGDIESNLNQIESIGSAVVLMKDDKLIAYIVKESKIGNDKIREYIKDRVPNYMIPSYFVEIDSIPLTTNGKVDKKNLLSIELQTIIESKNTLNSKEIAILEIFEEVLNNKISIEDNFFEVGGDSLNGVKVISMVNHKFNKELKLSYIFEHQIVKEFANSLDIKERGNMPYTIFNRDKVATIVILPALIDSIDYKITPKKLSKYLSNYKIYAFDFILEEDRISKYASFIDAIDDEVILLGYSSGGNLAFEVIKEMQNSAKKLILLDSWKIDDFNSVDREEVLLEFKKDNLVIDYNIIDKYIIMLNSMKNIDKISSDIDIVLFNNINQNWRELTKNNFRKFIGFGNHFNMLKDDNLTKNCHLINNIIKGESNEN